MLPAAHPSPPPPHSHPHGPSDFHPPMPTSGTSSIRANPSLQPSQTETRPSPTPSIQPPVSIIPHPTFPLSSPLPPPAAPAPTAPVAGGPFDPRSVSVLTSVVTAIESVFVPGTNTTIVIPDEDAQRQLKGAWGLMGGLGGASIIGALVATYFIAKLRKGVAELKAKRRNANGNADADSDFTVDSPVNGVGHLPSVAQTDAPSYSHPAVKVTQGAGSNPV
ncbi:hypothetical protein K402DRAFT_231207 [Aulographum hederae CBS 113979]|uniref:Uncharacterized protein n=1 Tax=Aulographum hederae CBS 113979 TaxID=1176131 RepID=A0A6G1HBV2_9PEZI|nr:hypothetical protein K402DRAFT_231207 [Aulographum hederae CBS 113979]